MQLQPSKSRTLDFPIGDKTYSVPAAGVDAGLKLAEILTKPEAERVKLKMQTVDLFRLVLGDMWQQMADDGVPYTEAFRVGMACLAREQVLLYESGPDRWDRADEVAAAVWDSGIDPNRLAAYMAARQEPGKGTRRSTRRAAASTTPRPASGSGTSDPSSSSSAVSPSAGESSTPSGL